MLNNMLLPNSPIISLKIELYFCTIERDRRTALYFWIFSANTEAIIKLLLLFFSFLVKSQLQVEADLEACNIYEGELNVNYLVVVLK